MIRVFFLCCCVAVGFFLGGCDSSKSTEPQDSKTSTDSPKLPSKVRIGLDTNLTLGQGASERFLVTVDSGLVYSIQTYGSTDTRLSLLDSAEKEVVYKDLQPDSLNGRLVVTSTSKRSVVIRLENSSGAAGTTKLSVRQTGGADAFEPDNSLSGAHLVSIGSAPETHTITAGNSDWFKVPVVKGKFYKVMVNSDSAVVLQVFNGDSTVAASPTKSSLFFQAKVTGFHFVRAGLSASSACGYSISFSEDPGGDFQLSEPNNSHDKAILLATDSSVKVQYLSQRESEWFKFPVRGGVSYRVKVEAPFQVYISTYSNPTASYIDNNSGRVNYRAISDGMAFVRLEAAYKDEGRYKIAVSPDTVGIDSFEPDDLPSLATTISTNGVFQSHYLQPEENDWLKFQVDSGKAYMVDVDDYKRAGVYIYADSAGKQEIVYENIGAAGVKATVSGTFWVRVRSNVGGDPYGPYKVAVRVDTTSDVYEPDDTKEMAKSMEVGAGQQRYCQYGDIDWVKFRADSGATYQILLSTKSESEINIRLTSAASTTSLGSSYAWNGLTGKFNFTPNTSGDYFLAIEGGSSASSGVYSIAIAKQ